MKCEAHGNVWINVKCCPEFAGFAYLGIFFLFELPSIAGMLIPFRSGEFWHSADVLFLGEVMPDFSVDRPPFSLTILLLFALCRAGDHGPGPGPTLCEQTHLG